MATTPTMHAQFYNLTGHPSAKFSFDFSISPNNMKIMLLASEKRLLRLVRGAFFLHSSKNVILPPLKIYNAIIKWIRGFENRQNAKLELFPSENRLAKHLHASVAFGFADHSAYGTHYETVADFLAPMGKSCCPLSWASVSFETQKHVAHLAMCQAAFFSRKKHVDASV